MPHPEGAVTDVDAGSGAAIVVERSAYEAAGGLSAADDLDAAVVELCARLREQGGRVVLAPGAVVVDHRPVQARRELALAVDPSGPGWAAAVARSGAVLRRVADPRARPPLRFALTVAAPSAKVATRWGDWHLAQALAASLRRCGSEVRVQTADRADDLAGRACDVHVVLRGLRPVSRTVGQGHVLWIVSHPETIDDDELDAADLVLVASPRFADHLRHRTGTPVEVMLQATDHRRFRPLPVDPALGAGLRPRIYGGGWRGLVDPALVVADYIDNDVLATVYSSARVVLNDHWPTMRAWGFVSNRLFDVLACGTPVISDPVEGMEELFDGAVREYHTPSELRAQVEEVLADPAAARERAEGGRKVVLANHTFDHRAQQLVDALRRHLAAE
jgi:glycosyltransferase involved in cell wall biosynthesis